MQVKSSAWSKFFYFSAIFNFMAAAALLASPKSFFDLLGMEDIYSPEILPWLHQFGVLVLVFGLGYWSAGVDPIKNRAAIWMGCIGKILVFSAAVIDSIFIPALVPFAIFVVADLIFAIFFARFLSKESSVV